MTVNISYNEHAYLDEQAICYRNHFSSGKLHTLFMFWFRFAHVVRI